MSVVEWDDLKVAPSVKVQRDLDIRPLGDEIADRLRFRLRESLWSTVKSRANVFRASGADIVIGELVSVVAIQIHSDVLSTAILL